MTTHSKLSPSAAKRWLTCPGSIGLVERLDIKDSRSSKFAAEGTVAHELCELCLLDPSKNPEDFLGQTFESDGFKFKVTHDMVDAVTVYVDYIRDMLDDGIEMQVEVRCSLTSLNVPGMDGGTSDCVLIDRTMKQIAVIDYKHGQGVAVEAENNPQAKSYGLGVCLDLGIDKDDCWDVHNIIVQPRAHHPAGPIRVEETTSDELYEWAEQVLIPGGLATQETDAELVPSEDGCRFCLASGQCPALYKKSQEVAMLDFADDTLPAVESLSVEQKMLAFKHANMLKSFLVAIENQIKLEVDAGSTDYEEHFKLVRKTTHRKFTEDALDPDFSPLLDHMDEDDIFVQKPRTMTEIERNLKKAIGAKNAKEIMEEITFKPEGALVIAPISDKRRAVQPSIVSDFKDLD